MGVSKIPREEYEQWSAIMQTASTAIENRDELVEDAAGRIERNLTLIGATAIEDKLQNKVILLIGIFGRYLFNDAFCNGYLLVDL